MIMKDQSLILQNVVIPAIQEKIQTNFFGRTSLFIESYSKHIGHQFDRQKFDRIIKRHEKGLEVKPSTYMKFADFLGLKVRAEIEN